MKAPFDPPGAVPGGTFLIGTDGIAEALRFGVPLASAELIREYPPNQLEMFLPGIARRGARALGTYGDILLYGGKRPGKAASVWPDVVTGVAAMGLLAGADGITVLGVHFCPLHPCPHDAAERDQGAPTRVPPVRLPSRPTAGVQTSLFDGEAAS